MKYELTYKLSILFTLFVLIMLSCEKFPNNPDVNRNDSVDLIDTLPKIDSCFGDTCYSCNLDEDAQVIFDDMMDAYYNDNSSEIEEVLITWSDESKPDRNIPDSLKDIYAVYKEFFSPWDLTRICESEFGNSLYRGTKYYLIQPTITYDFSFKASPKNTFTIDDFKPEINNDTIKLLYHKAPYISALNCFLGSNNKPVYDSTVFTPVFNHNEGILRSYFLSSSLTIIHDHWSPSWHLLTHPEVFSISFNEKSDSALVKYRVAYQGAETILGKKDDKWEVAYFYMTWIE